VSQIKGTRGCTKFFFNVTYTDLINPNFIDDMILNGSEIILKTKFWQAKLVTKYFKQSRKHLQYLLDDII